MEKKIVKFQSQLSNKELTLIIDERLDKVDLKKIAPGKQAKCNEALKDIKLPK